MKKQCGTYWNGGERNWEQVSSTRSEGSASNNSTNPQEQSQNLSWAKTAAETIKVYERVHSEQAKD